MSTIASISHIVVVQAYAVDLFPSGTACLVMQPSIDRCEKLQVLHSLALLVPFCNVHRQGKHTMHGYQLHAYFVS